MLLSVIVPVYNTEKYLRACLDSILAQTCQSFEIIIINDGSTDGSGDILKEYENKYIDKVKVIYQENSGIGYTRNRGIEEANGKYITFIDSDDTIEPTFCERLCLQAEKYNLDMVVSDYYEVNENTGKKSIFKVSDFNITNLKESPYLLFNINSSPWNKIYKREMLINANIRFPETLKYEDVLFVLEAIDRSQKIGKVSMPLVNYLIREDSETTVMDLKVFDIFQILDRLKDYFIESSNYEFVNEYLEWFVINRITVYCLQQRYQKDIKAAEKFIDQGYSYLRDNYVSWKKNHMYIKSNSISKRIIKNNRWIVKFYVKIARKRFLCKSNTTNCN